MARRSRGGDRVLESRHLIGLFVGVVILCCVFFALGYAMGRSNYAGAVQAADVPTRGVLPAVDREKVQPKEDTPAPAGEWDFYPTKKNSSLEKPAPPANGSASGTSVARESEPEEPPIADTRPVRTTTRPPRAIPPKTSANNVILQVAAVTHHSDALAMADALQRKKFPAFVIAPAADNFYRVQVGPYPDERAAENAKSALDRAGFKAIIKR